MKEFAFHMVVWWPPVYLVSCLKQCTQKRWPHWAWTGFLRTWRHCWHLYLFSMGTDNTLRGIPGKDVEQANEIRAILLHQSSAKSYEWIQKSCLRKIYFAILAQGSAVENKHVKPLNWFCQKQLRSRRVENSSLEHRWQAKQNTMADPYNIQDKMGQNIKLLVAAPASNLKSMI